MNVARTAADVLAEHTTLELEWIDRMYLNVYVALLQTGAGTAYFFRQVRGNPVPSALMEPMTRRFVGALERYAAHAGVDLIRFDRGERKDDRTQAYLRGFSDTEGVLYIGKAQEKARVVRTERREDPVRGPYPWLASSTAMVNHYYAYLVDQDFGPLFLKFCSYFPYNAKLCINGHEYLKRQLAKEGIAFGALDNGVPSCADPARMRRIAAGLDAAKIDALLRKWLARLPHPFTDADRRAGIRYDVSVLQAEFALTQVHDRPVQGRVFFEQVMRENLDLGRPDHVQLIFDRRVTRRTPSRYRTRVITDGVIPSLHVDYKHSRIRSRCAASGATTRRGAHCAPRPWSTTPCPQDRQRPFDVGRRLKNLDDLKRIGFAANRRGVRPRPHDLRPAPAAAARPHRAHPVHPPIPRHRPRPANGPVLPPDLRPRAAPRDVRGLRGTAAFGLPARPRRRLVRPGSTETLGGLRPRRLNATQLLTSIPLKESRSGTSGPETAV